MRMILGTCSEWVCRWVSEQLGHPNTASGREYGIAIVHRDQIIAGVVYHDWTDHNVFISMASTSPYWASKLTLRQIFGYAFNQMGVNRVSVIVRGGDKKWRKTIQNRLGFTSEGRMEDWYGEGRHAYLFRMKRSECKWIDDELRERQVERRAAV